MAKTKQATQKKPLYDVHPGVALVKQWIHTLPEKTGRSLDEWLELIRRDAPADIKERRAWLKQEYNLGTNTAWWLADRAAGKGAEEGDDDAYLETRQKSG